MSSSAALFTRSLRAMPAVRPTSASVQPAHRQFASPSRPSRQAEAPLSGKPKPDDVPEDPTHTGRIRIGASLALALGGAWLYFRNPYIEGEGKTPSTSEQDLAHALKSSGGKAPAPK